MSSVRREPAGLVLDLAEQERAALAGLFAQLGELVADEGAPTADPGTDELAAMVGIGTATHLPLDPALARLFPDAYHDDAMAAGDFRRYTEHRLRAAKRRNLDVVLDGLAQGGELVLDESATWCWLAALNDLRLVLGVRLDVAEDDDPLERLDEQDGDAYALYLWLTELQGALLEPPPAAGPDAPAG